MAKHGEIGFIVNHQRIAMKSTCLKATAFALLLGLGALPAHAQYVWLNEQGVKQFSDQPPPSSVPKNRILKNPGMPTPPPSSSYGAASASAAASAPDAAKAPEKDKGPMTTAEREAEYRKRKAEQAEKEKKAADEAKVAANKTAHCEGARAYIRSLESGERVSKTETDGAKTILGDEQRAKELREAKGRLEGC
jgi:hypothetical protein